jgi:hypothetical protein
MSAPTDPALHLRRQLLEWIAAKPRTYAETIDAWRTSCPRLSIWEDACIDGLIDCAPDGSHIVSLSAKGRDCLSGSVASAVAATIPH